MPATKFDRDAMASWYANEHLKTDPGVRTIYYLPKHAPKNEIRFIEINELISDRNDDSLEPIDYGVDTGTESEHKLYVLDVTPSQWESIGRSPLVLPRGWSLEDKQEYTLNA